MLESDGPLIGAVDGLDFDSSEAEVPVGSRLFVYSDGAFEISRPDGTMWAFADFLAALTAPAAGPASPIDSLVSVIRGVSQRDDFNDDFSMVELGFG
jgi:sigma-B regulation protein RsbU (phosphoserine phosphatase)